MDLHQHINDSMMTNLLETDPNITTSFLNMRMASAPIQKMEERVKYRITMEDSVQRISVSVRSIPVTNERHSPKRAMNNWMWNLVTSLPRRLLCVTRTVSSHRQREQYNYH